MSSVAEAAPAAQSAVTALPKPTVPKRAVPDKQLCCPGLADPSLSDRDAEDIVVILKALADPIRLRLIHLIAQSGEACACDLPAALDRSQPTVSHHLKVLVEAGLLEREKRGKWAWFSVRSEQLAALGSVFEL